VSQPGRAVLLTRLFPAPEILSELASTPLLREIMRRTDSKPVTLQALLDAVVDANGRNDECFVVPPTCCPLSHSTRSMRVVS
jgi:hypothetical protein